MTFWNPHPLLLWNSEIWFATAFSGRSFKSIQPMPFANPSHWWAFGIGMREIGWGTNHPLVKWGYNDPEQIGRQWNALQIWKKWKGETWAAFWKNWKRCCDDAEVQRFGGRGLPGLPPNVSTGSSQPGRIAKGLLETAGNWEWSSETGVGEIHFDTLYSRCFASDFLSSRKDQCDALIRFSRG